MGNVTALMMDVITEKSGHSLTPCAVSVCLTPAAPSPLPIPYPVISQAVEGITDPPMRTKVEGEIFATTGSVLKTCHGNEPGTLKETCSLNTSGPCFVIMGAPIVICELGMMGITGSMCISNKAVTVGAGGTASGAGGAGGPGGGAGGAGADGGGPSGPSGPSNGGGGGGGSNSGAAASAASPGTRGSGADAAPGASSGPAAQHQCQNGHPVDMATGWVVDEAVDLEVQGIIPFVLKRYYSSGRRNDVRATLGAGWAHNWEMALWEEERVTVLRDAEGRSIFFDKLEVGGEAFHRGERMELRRLTAQRWELFHVGTRLTYRLESFSPGGDAVLRHIHDAWENRVELGYTNERLVDLLDTAGRTARFTWDGARIARVEVRVGGSSEVSVDYAYTEAGCLASVTDALGQVETFDYDGQRRMIATTLKTGVTFRYEYEEDSGRCIRTWGPKGLYDLAFTYEPEHHRTIADGEEPRVYTTDEHGHVTREALPNGVVLTERAYDESGFLIATVNGAGEGPKSWYDARGNLVRRVDADGAVTAWEYDARDLATKRVLPDGKTWQYLHDERGALSRVVFPTGVSLSYAHDERGRLVRVDSAEGAVRAYEHDSHGNVASETDAVGARTAYGYDPLGRPISKTDALGRTTRTVRDRLGRVTCLSLPDGATIRRELDARGNVVREIDPMGRVIARTYGGMGKVAQITEPDGRKWRFRYTGNERLAEVTNPSGEIYGFTYDEAGKVVAESTFDGRELRYRWDAGGRVSEIGYPDGSWLRYGYDRSGRLRTEEASDGSSIRYVRDKVGRVVSARLDEPGRAHETRFERDAFGRIRVDHQGEHAIAYEYDLWSRIAGRALPTGTKTSFSYDRQHRLAGVTHAGRAFEVGRDAVGRERSIASGDRAFSLSFGRDALDHLIEQRLMVHGPVGSPAEVVHTRRHRFDRAGRLEETADDRWGIDRFAYDPAGRVANFGATEREEAFRYDSSDSLVARFEEASNARLTWKVAPGNVLQETPTAKLAYDKRGRRIGSRDLTSTEGPEKITHHKWDARDRLREVTFPDGRRVLFDYDALDRRVKKTVYAPDSERPEKVVDYLWSGNCVVAELPHGAAPRTFVHRPGTFEPLLHEERGDVFLCGNDPLGAPRELIDRAGGVAWSVRCEPWGAPTAEYVDPSREQTGTVVRSPFRHLGQYYDEDVDLSFTRFRVFDASTARWLSPDPLGLSTSSNLFSFDGCPTYVTDPLGLTGDPHIVHHDSEAAARRAALREAGMPTSDTTRHNVSEVESRPGSQAPTGPRGTRTEISDTANPNGPTVHHDPYGHRFDDGSTIPPHWGVDRPDGSTTHHTYPSDHDPSTNR